MARIPVVVQQQQQGPVNPAALTATPTVTRGLGPALPREYTGSRPANQVQRNTRRATQQATAADDADTFVAAGVTFQPGTPVLITHYLARVWKSYRIENMRGSFARFIATPNATTDKFTISIMADAACVADVRVW